MHIYIHQWRLSLPRSMFTLSFYSPSPFLLIVIFCCCFCYCLQADKEPYKINSGAKSEAKLPAVYRAHHNARILCVMEHPTLKTRQNSSLLLDVQCKYFYSDACIFLPLLFTLYVFYKRRVSFC